MSVLVPVSLVHIAWHNGMGSCLCRFTQPALTATRETNPQGGVSRLSRQSRRVASRKLPQHSTAQHEKPKSGAHGRFERRHDTALLKSKDD